MTPQVFDHFSSPVARFSETLKIKTAVRENRAPTKPNTLNSQGSLVRLHWVFLCWGCTFMLESRLQTCEFLLYVHVAAL